MITCPKCGASNKTGAAVCRMCATPLSRIAAAASSPDSASSVLEASLPKSKQEATNSVDQEGITCPECKTYNEVGWSFCQQCGKKLAMPAQPPPATDWKPADGFRTVASNQLIKAGILPSDMTTAEEIPAGGGSPPPTAPGMGAEVRRSAEPSPKPAAHKPAAPNPPPPTRAATPQASPPLPSAERTPEPPEKTPHEAARPAIGGVFCTQCGQTNNSGAQFCASCGAPIATGPPQTMVMSSPVKPVLGRLYLVMEGGQQGEVFDLEDETVVGRASGEITFPHDGFMSGRHARIERRGATFVLTDEGSRNGTFIKIKDEVELKHGDMILIGKQLFRFDA
jgi:predicted amidophosphoribosyltransferase